MGGGPGKDDLGSHQIREVTQVTQTADPKTQPWIKQKKRMHGWMDGLKTEIRNKIWNNKPPAKYAW